MTTRRTQSTAHFPSAMLTSAMGASTRAVAALHRSTVSLDAAPASGPGRERLEGVQKLLRGEIRPQSFGHVELGIGYLPEQEVRDAKFAAGTDHKVHLGHLGGVEVAGEGRLVHFVGR